MIFLKTMISMKRDVKAQVIYGQTKILYLKLFLIIAAEMMQKSLV